MKNGDAFRFGVDPAQMERLLSLKGFEQFQAPGHTPVRRLSTIIRTQQRAGGLIKQGVTMKQDIDEIVSLAMEGDRHSLEALIESVQDRIYKLALKMLYHRVDAEDATQEILIKIVTRLDSFRQTSAFHTWALKIASNHLLNKRKDFRRWRFTFQSCEEMIMRDLPDQSTLLAFQAEQEMVVAEMRISCMQGLIQCLDWDHRLVYILGETMDITGPEGAAILDIAPATFRKRLSRSRKRIREFLSRNCELYAENNPCKCVPQAMAAIDNAYIDPKRLQYVDHPQRKTKDPDVAERLHVMDGLSREAALIRDHPDYAAPEAFIEGIRKMIDSGQFNKLRNFH
jgi:RNA polymerase sigma factor (sigma-70 family)